jgi:hypothetical protein
MHQIPVEWLGTAGMQDFTPLRLSYLCESPHELIALADIARPKRDSRIVFDCNGLRRDRTMAVLAGIREDLSLPPIQVKAGGRSYRVHNGFHRFYASLALGFSHIPAVIVAD